MSIHPQLNHFSWGFYKYPTLIYQNLRFGLGCWEEIGVSLPAQAGSHQPRPSRRAGSFDSPHTRQAVVLLRGKTRVFPTPFLFDSLPGLPKHNQPKLTFWLQVSGGNLPLRGRVLFDQEPSKSNGTW